MSGDHHTKPAPSGAASPQEVQRQLTRRVVWGCLGMLVLAGGWSLWPLPSEEPAIDQVPMVERPARASAVQSWNLSAFEAALWHAPPAEVVAVAPAPPPPPPPPPPLRLQLIGIVRLASEVTSPAAATAGSTPAGLQAAIYDPDSDTTHIVGDGAMIGARTVARVEADRVTFTLGDLVQSLVLDSDQPATKAANRGGAR